MDYVASFNTILAGGVLQEVDKNIKDDKLNIIGNRWINKE